MPIIKNQELFLRFEKIYWQYFLELEEQFLSTKRYVAFDKANFKTFSTEYLKLLVAVCGEIDTVGKAIRHSEKLHRTAIWNRRKLICRCLRTRQSTMP